MGDGNCLFCSASLLLVGEESLASVLRLLAVVQAVTHFDHYMPKVSTKSYTNIHAIQVVAINSI